MRQLKVLELFSGTRSIGKAFEARGHEVYSIDWERKFKANWYTDIEYVRAEHILKRFGRPDVIWMSPDCSSYSVAAISRHRRKNADAGGCSNPSATTHASVTGSTLAACGSSGTYSLRSTGSRTRGLACAGCRGCKLYRGAQ